MGRAARGSQRWLQFAVNEQATYFNAAIADVMSLPSEESIFWLSPLRQDNYREYWDQTFIDVSGIELPYRSLAEFWPSGGPHWDGLARTSSDRLLLIEAKANIPEMVSNLGASDPTSIQLIRASLEETKQHVGVTSDVDWAQRYYQYANRLAHLYLLRHLNRLPADLLYVCFVNDTDTSGPETVEEWQTAIDAVEQYLGLPDQHLLSEYVHHIYVDVNDLT